MPHRALRSLTASLVLAGAAVAPAYATDEPAPLPLQAAPPLPVIQAALQGAGTACTDTTAPMSRFGRTAARRAGRTGVLRGTARDQAAAGETACGVAVVTVSVTLRDGRLCRHLTAKGRLSRRLPCGRARWLLASGTSDWRLALPARLRRGTYRVRTRAVDFAGNAETPRAGRRFRRVRLG
jgi:hypothetical protein